MSDSFIDAIRTALGNAPESDRLRPGKVVRFSTNGKRSDDGGWALLFADEQGGVFGDWRTGFEETWQAKSVKPLSKLDRQVRSREIEQARRQRDADQVEKHERGAELAASIWKAAPLCAQHAYLQRKRIGAQGLRLQRGHLGGCAGSFYVAGQDGRSERLKGDLLLIPMYGADKRLWSLQAIDTEGRKSFLKGGRTRGLFFPVGSNLLRDVDQDLHRGEVAIAEGLATAVTVHELGQIPVFTAFNAGNLAHVAEAIRLRLPLATITIAGDVDPSGIGQAKAEGAARKVGGFVSFPPFTVDELAAGSTDWNDYAALHPQGVDEARQA
jgi:putative DNA primase/helicase